VTRNRIAEARQVLELIGTPDTEAELKEIQDSMHFEKSALHERAVPAQVSGSDLSGGDDCAVQPAFGHQRDPVLRERHFYGGGIFATVR
jgi:hypothetical protein